MLSYPSDRLPGGQDESFALWLEPDYTKSTFKIYHLVMVKSIQQRQNLEILSYVDHGSILQDDFPSWIPRWDRPCTAGMLDELGNIFDACGTRYQIASPHNTYLQLPLYSEERSLKLSGIQCTSVEHLTETMDLLDVALTAEAAVRNPIIGLFGRLPTSESDPKIQSSSIAIRPVLDFNASYPSGESLYSAYARTLSLDEPMVQNFIIQDPLASLFTMQALPLTFLSSMSFFHLIIPGRVSHSQDH
jgi:hypothetical protein